MAVKHFENLTNRARDGYQIRTDVAWLRTKHPKPLDESAKYCLS